VKRTQPVEAGVVVLEGSSPDVEVCPLPEVPGSVATGVSPSMVEQAEITTTRGIRRRAVDRFRAVDGT
jgi:hypothetical protein